MPWFLCFLADAHACTTCDPSLRAALGDDLARYLLTIPVPLLLGSALVTATVRRAVTHLEGVRAATHAPIATAGALLGLGLGGFLDGIVLHQVLQVHQMLSNVIAPDTVLAKNVNMFWDGVFHLSTWSLTSAGVWVLWTASGRSDTARSTRVLLASGLLGWGAFNVLDSVANHYVFRYHDLVERSARPWAWNHAFLVLGLAQCVAGWAVVHRRVRAGV